jgi:type II secretory pathway pseudopilin PulG
VELLVAMGVLALLLAVLSSFFGGVSNAWQFSRSKMENFEKGRALIHSVSRDLSAAVVRQDLPAFPNAASGKLDFFLRKFGQSSATGSERPLTFVSYAVKSRNGQRVLVRTDEPYDFASSAVSWEPFGTNSAGPGGSAAVERILCSGVVAFSFHFINADGSVSAAYRDGSQAQPSVAVRVALAILDERAAVILSDSGAESQLLADLSADLPSGQTSYKAAWDGLLAGGQWTGKYPRPVLAGLQTYERVTPLPRSPLVLKKASP